MTPAGRLSELGEKTPLKEEVALAYDAAEERLHFSNWAVDRAVARLPSFPLETVNKENKASRLTKDRVDDVKRCL